MRISLWMLLLIGYAKAIKNAMMWDGAADSAVPATVVVDGNEIAKVIPAGDPEKGGAARDGIQLRSRPGGTDEDRDG